MYLVGLTIEIYHDARSHERSYYIIYFTAAVGVSKNYDSACVT